MIPRTFPSIIEALQTKMVVYVLPSITGLTAWIDYIPVKGVTTESNALANTYALDGYQVVKTIESLTGKQAWLDYIPVFESASYNKPWSTDAGGYIPAGGLFSIASLFANGEQGTWYDPSDLTTLFQDSAGTIPVTAVQQPVGLMLDKSKGLVLGPELVTNGDFSNGTTGWTAANGATISVVSGALRVTNTGTLYGAAYVAVSTKIGATYKIGYVIGGATAPPIIYTSNSSTTFNNFTVVIYLGSPKATYFTATATTTYIWLFMDSATTGAYVEFDNISVKELPGNHAFQKTSASRPVLSARYNLLTKTEQFDDAVWSKDAVIVTSNAVTAPDGTLTADKIVESATTTTHRIYQIINVLQNNTVVIHAKAAERNWIRLNFNGFGPVNFDLANGVVGSTAAGITASIVSAGNGWYQCRAFGDFGSGSTNYIIDLETSDNGTGVSAQSYAGDGTSGIYLWGTDLRVSNDALSQPAYQRVNTATDYDTVGFKPYLAFDGVDDSLVTNSIDFTATDKMTVFAGVRKLRDTSANLIAELSSNSDSGNNGSFALLAASTGADYAVQLYGTSLGYYLPSVFAAPITNVLTGAFDIGASSLATEVIPRINGVVKQGGGFGTAGSGNFGNYSLFIGRRGGASLPFNGRLYSLIVRGAASTTAQITSTETYMNQKTGAY